MGELIDRTSRLKIGDGLDPTVDLSPLSSQSQFDTVMEYIGIGAEEGAILAYGGHAVTGGDFDQGYYVNPLFLPMSNPTCASPKKKSSARS